MNIYADVALIFLSGPVWASLLTRMFGLRRLFFARWAGFDALGLLSAAFLQDWRNIPVWAASAVVALILWWWSRRKRKRTLAALGNKARARLAAMIKKMPKPGPVLRPVPQLSPGR
jgi:hypothetical protein